MVETDYKVEKLNEYRYKRKFAILPFFIDYIDDRILWHGKIFTFVNVYQEKYRISKRDFDSGWTYTYYWTDWKYKWINKKIK